MNPSVIFLNGPEIEEKRKLVAKLKNQFQKQVCICINRKELIQMMKGDQDLDDQSYEWMIPKMLKSLLNNGVSVVFDAFLPTRRSQQYISLMKGLPCYWIGVFFDKESEESGDYYDFSVHFQEAGEVSALSDDESCDLSDDSVEVKKEAVIVESDDEDELDDELDDEESDDEEDAESEQCDASAADQIIDEFELKAMEIFAFIMKNQPSCYTVENNSEVTAEKREIGGRDFSSDRPERSERAPREGGERSFGGDRGGSRDGGERRSYNDRGPSRSFGGDRGGSRDGGERRSFSGERKSFGDRSGSRDGGERRSFGDRSGPSRSFGDRSGPSRSFGDRSSSSEGGERKSFGGERRSFGDRSGPSRSFGDRSPSRSFGDRSPSRSFGDRSSSSEGGERKSFGGERRSFGDRSGPSRSFGGDRGGSRDGGERKSFGGERRSFGDRSGSRDGGERRSFGDRSGPSRSFGGDRGGSRDGGERKSFGGPRSFGRDRDNRSEAPKRTFEDRSERTEKKSDSDKS